MNKKEFGKVILNVRKQKGITQHELAEQLNVTHTAVSHWENGRYYPDVELFPKIAEILQLDVYQLFLGEKTDTKQSGDERFCNALQFAGKICAQKVKRRNYVIFILSLLCAGFLALIAAYLTFKPANYLIVDAYAQEDTLFINVMFNGNKKLYDPEKYSETVDKIIEDNFFETDKYANLYVYIYDRFQNREENHLIGEIYYNLDHLREAETMVDSLEESQENRE